MAPYGITPKNSPYFIPPYEWYNARHASWAKELGLQVINFTPGTQSNSDYTWIGLKYYRDNKWLWNSIMNWEKQHSLNGHFLMIHLGKDSRRPKGFYEELPKLIKTLKKRGYNFVTPEQMTGLNFVR